MAKELIKVTGVKRKEPDIGLYVLALVALVRQLQADASGTPDGQDGANV
jgi:hypothetical protein